MLIGASSVFSITFVTLIGWWALSRVLARLLGVPDVHKLERQPTTGPVAPVPVRLRDVRFRYPGGDHDALGPVSLNVEPGEHVAITGRQRLGQDDADAAARRPRSRRRAPSNAPARSGWAGSVAPRWSCSTPKVRCWARAWPTTWCGDCRRRAPPTSTGCSPRSASTGWPNATPAGCPVANCSGWPWPPRWPASRRC